MAVGTNDVGTNDVVVAKELGYLRHSSEENSKNIDKFFVLLEDHMKGEEKERTAMNNKFTMLLITMIVIAMKDTGVTGVLGGVLKTFFPFIF